MGVLKKRVYLDFAAAAPIEVFARRAFESALKVFGNPSSPHTLGREARALLEKARTGIARELSVKPDDVLFTSGATEANALLIHGHIRARIEKGAQPGDLHVLYLPTAHASVYEAMQSLKGEGVVIEPLRIVDGAIDVHALREQLQSGTVLVVVDAVCSETGAIWNVREVAHIVHESSPAIVHVDASQAPLVLSPERSRFLADTLSLDAQKIGGVRGCGVLALPRAIPLVPLYRGGGQERELRPGTESPALAASFSAALIEARKHREAFTKRAAHLRRALITSLTSALPTLLVNEGAKNAPHILNISLPGYDTEYLAALLDKDGFSVSTKSACATDEPESRVVRALTNDEVRARSTLRISFGRDIRTHELLAFSKAFLRAVTFLEKSPV